MSEQEDKVAATGFERRELMSGRTMGLIIATLLLFGLLAMVSDTFLSSYTMFIISRQVAFFTLIAFAQAVCLVVGGMNLAVGAVGSVCTVCLGLCLVNLGLSGWVAVPITIAFGALAGLLNGMLIVKLKINSFIVTLSMMFIYMGLRSGISGGNPYEVGAGFTVIGQKGFMGIP